MSSKPGQAVVALHGFGGFGADFDRVRGPGWITPDLPGAPLEDVLAQLAQTLPAEPFRLIGYSMGARVALAFTLARPERVQQLTLIGATAGLTDAAARAQRCEDDGALADRITALGAEAFDRAWREHPLIRTQDRLPEPFLSELRARRCRQPTDRLLGHLTHLSAAVIPSMWPDLHRITCDVELVSGSEDAKYTRLARKLAEWIEGATVTVVDGAGHAPHLEADDLSWLSLRRP